MATLFDVIDRGDLRPAQYAEPHFVYLNYSGRPDAERIRRLLEGWFGNYPALEAPELRARFRSPDDSQHSGAFFELVLHQLLTSLGCSVELHPQLPSSSKRIDFKAHPPSGEPFYLEATLALEANERRAERTAAGKVLDVINRIGSTAFFLHVEVLAHGREPISTRKLRSFLQSQLRLFDPDELIALHAREPNFLTWPALHYEQGDWVVSLVPFGRSPESRGKSGLRAVGAIGAGIERLDSVSQLERAINKKASRYGDLDIPYVIAVNGLGPWTFDRSEIVDALYGGERPDSRQPTDSAWFGPNGPRNRRVAAALISSDLSPWTLRVTEMCLYTNPWAPSADLDVLAALPQVRATDRMPLLYTEGRPIADILDVPSVWPDKSPL